MRRVFPSMLGGVMVAAFLAAPLGGQEKPTVPTHDMAGKDNCLMCHAVGVMPPVPDVPESHEGRENLTCLWCHAADSPMQTTGPMVVGHDLAGKDNCLMCHAVGVMPPVPDVPEDHADRTVATCTWCHLPPGSARPGSF